MFYFPGKYKAWFSLGTIYAILILCFPNHTHAQRFLLFNTQKDLSRHIKTGDSCYFAGNYKESIDAYSKITAVVYEEEAYLNQIQNQLAAADTGAASASLKLMADSGFYRFWIVEKDLAYEKLRQTTAYPQLVQQLKENFNHYLSKNQIKNADLTRQVMEMYYDDQYYQWMGSFKNRYPSAYTTKTYEQIDALKTNSFRNNVAQLKELFRKHGYLWYRDVGKEATHYIWLIVQHADYDRVFQEDYLKALDKAVKRKQALGLDLAYLTDRVRKNKNEKQVYGTQMEYKTIEDAVKGKSVKMQPWPVEDPEKLDERRKAVGLMPMEKYLEMMRKLNNNQ